ncbi:FAD dependent oxidoreductase superfamily [Thozetella sp. PMI_491]|nr:FAD dependent oxidoreductase superfamily [Thozetella sp. PMI_491]
MSADLKENVVVIGAGILGLTSAIQLQTALGPSKSVMIVARDLPSDESIQYTSPWAGAHGRFMPAETFSEIQHEKFSRVTYDMLLKQACEDPACGVEFMDGYDFLAKPSEAYKKLKGGYGTSPGFKLLSESEFPPGMGITFGTRYRTWSLNSPVYCAYLLRRFRLKGGLVLKKTLFSVEEAFSLASNVPVVVNCSGFGFGDPMVYPIRGQTCLVSNPCDRTITQLNADGSFNFIIPRPLEGGTIIGGTKEAHDWEDQPRAETRTQILETVAKLYPPILGPAGKFEVIRDIVGRRPARAGGLRLETETPRSPMLRGKKIVHAYGAGGSGYALSWGVANEVVKMVLDDIVPVRASL